MMQYLFSNTSRYCYQGYALLTTFKWIFFSVICYNILFVDMASASNLKAAVIGASGGVGQQVCKALSERAVKVTAIGRDLAKLNTFDLLANCKKLAISNSDISALTTGIDGSDFVVISVGTTAFPTKAWENGANTPKIACFDSVANILSAVKYTKKKPKKVVLVTSIGVERADDFPFKILNIFDVLTEKLKSEELLIKESANIGFTPIICRPGRLIGAPFTNQDLAKLFKIEQEDKNCGIVIDPRDVLNGDVARKDVAESIVRFLLYKDLAKKPVKYSIVNKAGKAPNDLEWSKLLSLCAMP